MKKTGKRKMHLVQTVLSLPILKQLDALAKVAGHKRAGYLRHIVELHVENQSNIILQGPGPGLPSNAELAKLVKYCGVSTPKTR